MKQLRLFLAVVPTGLVLATLAGCGSSQKSAKDAADKSEPVAATAPTDKSPAAKSEQAAIVEEPKSGPKPFKLGDGITPFTPPTLAELDKSVEWVDGPIVDSMARLRAQKAKEPPLVTVPQALAMKNESAEANKKILSALSELAPPDGNGVNWDDTMSRALIADLSSINPLLANGISEFEISGLTSFNLFGFDWEMIPFAMKEYVKSWQTSKDGLVDKVVMRDDLTWSDGHPITAHDVAFSFKLIMTDAVPIPSMRSSVDELKWVEAYDDHTLVYFHKQPSPTNIWNVNFQVVPKHIFEKSAAEDPTLRTSAYHRNLELHPISGGEYEVVRWNRGQDIILKRREGYYMHNGKQVRDKPNFAQMRFRIIEDANTRLLALKSGDIEEGELETEQWQTQTNGDDYYRDNTKVVGPEWLYMYIGWNMDTKKVPFFGDQRVRQAMAYAFNEKQMLNDLCYGLYTQCTGIFHPDAWMYPKGGVEAIHQNLDKAEDLLDQAGWVDSDSDGVRDKEINGKKVKFEFTLIVSNKPDRIAICNLFRENLESIGVLCNVRPLEAAVFQERIFKKNFEAEMAGWGSGTDPSLEKNIFGTGEARNFGSYSNPKVDELLKQGLKEFDHQKRAEIYGQIHKIIYDDQPYLFLYNRNSLYGFSKKLRGYRFSPRGPFHYSPGIDSIWTPSNPGIAALY
jgi:peptide/nickel transport system substrate-binding protein